mmetsp:Transcript_10560/g.13066  ORF Transcript_10560/g.13066 Transcript_10560/m.13066 type:complete len:137 (-) Transcript_10560:197-607(-)
MKVLVLLSDTSSLIPFNMAMKVGDPERDEILLFSASHPKVRSNLNYTKLVDKAKQEGFLCSHIVSTGEVTDLLEKNIKDFEIDLVIVGCREVSAMKKALFGSVSEFATQNLSCSVLIAKRDTEVIAPLTPCVEMDL